MSQRDESSDAQSIDQRDEKVSAEMVAEYQCPICGERATLHCAGCGRVFCAEHVQRGFALGYTFLCITCAGSDSGTDADTGAADSGTGAR